jgi:hypothetical protein
MSYFMITESSHFEGDKFSTMHEVEEAISDAVLEGNIDIDEAKDLTVSEVNDLSVNIEVTVTVEVC